MVKPDYDSTVTTGMSSVDYLDSSLYPKSTAHKDFYKVSPWDTDASSGTEYRYTGSWRTWHGYYRSNETFAAIVDKLTSWVIGRGIKFKSKKDEERVKKIHGIGKDTFTSILKNAIRVAVINGDSFAEKIESRGLFGLGKGLINLKPLNPGSLTIVVDGFNMIKKYEQIGIVNRKSQVVDDYSPEEIFHLSFGRIADEVHGVPLAEKMETILKAEREGFLQTKVLMRRHVQPVLVISTGTDVTSEVTALKTKIDNAYRDTENVFVPEDTIKKIESISTPQFSTIDPIPWLRSLKRSMVTAGGVPEVVMGWGEETTEASSQVIYLAYEQTISDMQLEVEEQVLAQLGIEIELEFPASLEEIMSKKEKKDGNAKVAKNPAVNPGSAVKK